jgi:DNA-binding CsgD family transcriptional regulator
LLAKTTDAAQLALILAIIERAAETAAERLAKFPHRYRLTGAETEVMGLVLRAREPKRIAALRGSSPWTVRSKINALVVKTQFNSQRELMARLGGGM